MNSRFIKFFEKPIDISVIEIKDSDAIIALDEIQYIFDLGSVVILTEKELDEKYSKLYKQLISESKKMLYNELNKINYDELIVFSLRYMFNSLEKFKSNKEEYLSRLREVYVYNEIINVKNK